MWPYWMLFLFPAAAAILSPRPGTVQFRSEPLLRRAQWWLASTVIWLMIGYREQVGGDWDNYLGYLEMVRNSSFLDALQRSDIGYLVLAWISIEMDWGVYGLNLLGGFIFTVGLVRFCRNLPRPWLALTISVPYLVLVLGMGYSRQGIALGLCMLGLIALEKRQLRAFVAWVVLGAMFHKTAVLVLPIAALANSKNRWVTMIWVLVISALAYFVLLADTTDSLVENYVTAQMQSEGALVRLLMNTLPAGIFLYWTKRFRLSAPEVALWRWFSILSILLLAVLFIVPSSTVVDRIALYMLPLQLVVFSHIPDVLGRPKASNLEWVALVVIYYALVLFVWLNFAQNAQFWIPYRFYPLEMESIW